LSNEFRQSTGAPVRIAMLDAHAAIHAAFELLIAPEPDLQPIGYASTKAELSAFLRRTRPDVVVFDLGPGRLHLCLEITGQPHAPAAVVYTASRDDWVAVRAALAGAGAVVSKSGPPGDLLSAIRTVAASPWAVAPASGRVRREAAARLDPADYPFFAMRLAGEPAAGIGETLGLSSVAVKARIARILARLEPIQNAE
jgi:DNA-binding NarL/FixJ family response regulator